ncbi:hypothetical protein GW17_00041504 [Ensete ventricosum]|nr:hypothetical protein GW17_00041504 [Ensete ventricosum]
MRRARLEVTTATRGDGCSLRLRLHDDGEEEWTTVMRSRAGRAREEKAVAGVRQGLRQRMAGVAGRRWREQQQQGWISRKGCRRQGWRLWEGGCDSGLQRQQGGGGREERGGTEVPMDEEGEEDRVEGVRLLRQERWKGRWQWQSDESCGSRRGRRLWRQREERPVVVVAESKGGSG